ncbi:hypothetical protein FIG89_02650 [Salmonella enterica subsp. enterica]|nr:hypothetical protein [Salmonella enterica subsp. enterica serovar Potsdam]
MHTEKRPLTGPGFAHPENRANVISYSGIAAIVPVIPGNVGRTQTHIASARALHKALGFKRDFTDWIKDRIKRYGFVEGVDYVIVENLSTPNPASTKSHQQTTQDYLISPNTWKVVMMEHSPTPTSRRTHKVIDRATPPGYRYHALYKTSAGIGTPISKKATPDAESVFFCVRYMCHFMAWCVPLTPVSIRIARNTTAHHAAHNGAVRYLYAGFTPIFPRIYSVSASRRQRMVTLAGQPQGWPVSFLPGSSNPVNVTAPIEIGTSSGDSLTSKKEAA